MPNETTIPIPAWRAELPDLAGRTVVLREPISQDIAALFNLLSLGDAARFGVDEPVTEFGVRQYLDRVARERTMGVSISYVITMAIARTIVGLVQVKQLDPAFEAAELECTIAPSARGSGVFIEPMRADRSEDERAHEARVLLQNGRANGALRKLGAVQEGVLRRSVRRGGEYFDQVLWSLLKEDWGDHWVSTAPRVH